MIDKKYEHFVLRSDKAPSLEFLQKNRLELNKQFYEKLEKKFYEKLDN
jgi:hypothetical protein